MISSRAGRRGAIGAVVLSSALLLLTAACADREPRREIEVLGLEEIGRQELEDSVARHRPGTDLASTACAVVLRDSMGYPDASVHHRTTRRPWPWVPPREQVSITVIGRDLSSHVRFRTVPEARPEVARWSEGLRLLREHRRAPAAFRDPDFLRGDVGGAPGGARRLRSWVGDHDAPEDWRLARRTLTSDGRPDHRILAALVLTNFPRRDSSYRLLADGLRYPPGPASTLAGLVLRGMAEAHRHRVDWSPARGTLDALLGGTHVSAFEDVLLALRHTGIEPRLARELVRENPHVFRMKVGSRFEHVRRPVIAFLEAVLGGDRGGDPGAWLRWLERPSGDGSSAGVTVRPSLTYL